MTKKIKTPVTVCWMEAGDPAVRTLGYNSGNGPVRVYYRNRLDGRCYQNEPPRALATGGGAGTRSLKARNALRRLVAGGFVASAGRGVYKLGPAGVAGADAAPKAKVKVGGAKKAKAAEPEEHAGTGVTPWLGGGE